MTDEVITSAAPETTTTAPVTTTETTAPAEVVASTTAEPVAEEIKKTPWFQTRIDHLTREKHEARREADDLRRQLTERASAPNETQNLGSQIDPVSIQRMADERANQIVKEQNFNQACNRVYDSGKKELGADFDAAIQNFNMLGGLSSHPALVEAATLLPEGHKILHHLGTNLEEAARIISLPPMQMALAISDIQSKVRTSNISSAPAPIKPLGSSGSTSTVQGPDDNGNFANQEAYKAWRAKNFKRA